MKCPIDNTQLELREKDDFTFNFCPQCRGVWLKKSELDYLIEKSEEDYPDIDEISTPSSERQQQRPGRFFGRVFKF